MALAEPVYFIASPPTRKVYVSCPVAGRGVKPRWLTQLTIEQFLAWHLGPARCEEAPCLEEL